MGTNTAPDSVNDPSGGALRGNRCKGTNLIDFLRILRQEGGDAREAECIARLQEDLRGALRYGAVVRGGWYPIHWYRALHAAAQEIGMGPGFARTVGRVSTLDDLSGGVYSVFLRIVTPAFLISGAARLFNRYYELGAMEIIESRSGYVHAKYRDCVGFDRNIWQDVMGGCEGALEAARARQVRVRLLEGGSDRDEHASVEVHYRE